MARLGANSRKKGRRLLEKTLVACESEFANFKENAGLEGVATVRSLLDALANIDASRAEHVALVQSLVACVEHPKISAFCTGVLCWAFAPKVENKVRHICRRNSSDVANACIVGLLEAARALSATEACGGEDVISKLLAGIEHGFWLLKREERVNCIVHNAVFQKGSMLRPGEGAGRRARQSLRLRFDEEERQHALGLLRSWTGDYMDHDKSFPAWDTIVLKGECIHDFLMQAANDDGKPSKKDADRISNAKARVNARLRDLLSRAPDARAVRRALEMRAFLQSLEV